MFKKTLLVLACSAILTACGGGGDSSSNNGGNNTENPASPASDLDKAKQLVDTTNTIISYFDSFDGLQSQYQPTFDAIAYAGDDLGNATGLALTLAVLAQQDSQGSAKTYNAAQLQTLLDAEGFIDYQLSNSTLEVTTTASSVSIKGTVTAKYLVGGHWDNVAMQWVDEFGEQATVTISPLTLTAPFTASASTYDFKIAAGGKIATKNTANKEASFSFKEDSTAKAIYTTAATLADRDTAQTPESAEFKFANLEFAAENVVITLNEFSSKAKKASLKDGTITETTVIPTELTFKGQAKLANATDSLGLEASIKLNNDLSQVIDVTNGESATAFVNADLSVKLSGNLKDSATTYKPFSLDLTAKRNEYQKGTATIKVAVDKDALTADFKTDNLIGNDPKAAHEPTVWAKLSHANGAYVEIADLDKFTSAQIKVGNTSYATVSKVSDNAYSAKFTDNSVKAIAP